MKLRGKWMIPSLIPVLAGGSSFIDTPVEETKTHPNVLFIAIDDLNDWTGNLGGHPNALTPNLDALGERGVVFTRTYCPAPLCNASRAALLTGMRPSTSGVYTNRQDWRESPAVKNATTLPAHFMEQGYRTLGSGKIYHGNFPDTSGWHTYWPSKTQTQPHDPLPENRPLSGIPGTGFFDWGPVHVPREEMGDWQVAEWVSKQLEKEYDKPFFLGCGFFRPHLPWYVPEEYFDRFPLEEIALPVVRENDLADVPEAGRDMARRIDHRNVTRYNQWKKAVQGYLASISFADDCLGRVIRALDESRYAENTIIVLWSDHGWHLGEKEHWRKFSLWEEANRCVFMVIAPGVTKPGTRCDEPVNLLDIYPTLNELCGLPPVDGLEGVSLVPLLKDQGSIMERPSLSTFGRNNHTLRTERWRYIRYADGSEELYNHIRDEYEWNNLAGENAYYGVMKKMSEWLPEVNVEGIPVSEQFR